MEHLGHFSWTWDFFKNALFTWQLALAGVCGFLAFMLWCYLLKKHDFSLVYPLTSISYIFGVLMAAFFMGETVPITRWIGVVIVVIGVYFIIK
ncbi:MAG: EamA family transporter [Bacteroidales bacterium]|nr:EamA family transporter [Bacteroidales bacterium]